MAYLSRKFGMYGNDEETTANEQLMAQVADFNMPQTRLCYTTDSVEAYDSLFASDVATHCGKFTSWLELRGRKFLVRDEPMAADFCLFECLDKHELISQHVRGKSFLEQHPRLHKYVGPRAVILRICV